eukprot:gb/GECG01014834.1/.p1 GENE.gb/GECG01014834.1/~~gb/GECG01014834.1/.p1  ORF type:complete len:129 (+),score=10.97 gb/GECG01014834.1/:1-387(+)
MIVRKALNRKRFHERGNPRKIEYKQTCAGEPSKMNMLTQLVDGSLPEETNTNVRQCVVEAKVSVSGKKHGYRDIVDSMRMKCVRCPEEIEKVMRPEVIADESEDKDPYVIFQPVLIPNWLISSRSVSI